MILTPPDFIPRDPAAIAQELTEFYQTLTGKTIFPAQVEQVFLDTLAYRETVVREAIQDAAQQNLVRFARAPVLDYLGELVGVTRLEARPARCLLRFDFTSPLAAPLLLPAGIRVANGDGSVVFGATTEAVVPAGSAFFEVQGEAQTAGAVGNGWGIGQIKALLDPLDPIASAANASVPAGGAEAESDNRLRARIMLAPESFSVAGPVGAYRHHAMRAHQSIVDVAVVSHQPGEVTLYPLTAVGAPPQEILDAVLEVCSHDKARPLCDAVLVTPPVAVEYSVAASLTVRNSADGGVVLAAAQKAVESLVAGLAARLGGEIVPSQIIAALSVDGVHRVELTQPASRRPLAAWEFARCVGVAVTVAGMAAP